jgi:hypothetical protein
MEHRRNFGRRAMPQASFVSPAAPAPLKPTEKALASASPERTPPSVEDEIRAWKSARRSHVGFPWRQLSLMAGLSFGIASFVLPRSVNEALQWPLYALTALSLYAGLRRRKTKPA